MTWTRLALASAWMTAIAAAFVLVVSAGCSTEDAEPEPGAPEGGGADTASRPSEDTGPPRVLGPAVECTIGATAETEPNDTAATANPFTDLGFCGALEKGTDVDFFTFDTPPGTKLSLFQAVIDGKVDFAITLNGATFGPSETAKFGSGTYVVKAFTTAGKPATYRIRVQFDAP